MDARRRRFASIGVPTMIKQDEQGVALHSEWAVMSWSSNPVWKVAVFSTGCGKPRGIQRRELLPAVAPRGEAVRGPELPPMSKGQGKRRRQEVRLLRPPISVLFHYYAPGRPNSRSGAGSPLSDAGTTGVAYEETSKARGPIGAKPSPFFAGRDE